jgi:drug/metabolite transporter (DMT)-like permease
MCGKLLFEKHSDLGAAPLLVYRAVISALALGLYLNTSLKATIWDCLERKTLVPLSTRVLCGNLSVFVNFMACKSFQLTTVAMVVNCAPLLTFFLAAILFKELITQKQTVSLLVGFGGLLLMIFGGESEEKRPEYAPSYAHYAALLMNPICMSAS